MPTIGNTARMVGNRPSSRPAPPGDPKSGKASSKAAPEELRSRFEAVLPV